MFRGERFSTLSERRSFCFDVRLSRAQLGSVLCLWPHYDCGALPAAAAAAGTATNSVCLHFRSNVVYQVISDWMLRSVALICHFTFP